MVPCPCFRCDDLRQRDRLGAQSRLLDNSYRGFRGRDRDRGLAESVRRFGREHQGARVLSAEPVLVHGRSLNRIKSLDADGRVWIWIDDPQAPRTPPRRAGEDGGD